MKKTMIVVSAGLLLFSGCFQSKERKQFSVTYPETKKVDQVDTYFGVDISDPYRWLEDDNSAETAEWVKQENEVTFGYLNQIPFRKEMENTLTEMWNYPKQGIYSKEQGKYFFSKNDGIQNQSVLYVKDSLHGQERVFMDPNTLSTDGTTAMMGYEVSGSGKYVAYMLSSGGSDWKEIRVKDIEGNDKADVLKWIKFSGISWYKEGFYYSRYDEPKGSTLSQKNEYHKIYYHQLGTPQEQDILIYEDKSSPLMNFSARVTEDEKYLIIRASTGTSGNSLYISPISEKGNYSFTKIVDDFKNDWYLVNNEKEVLHILTNNGAPTYRVVSYNIEKKDGFKELIPASEDVMQSVSMIGQKMVALYLHNAHSQVKIFSKEGKFETDLTLPEIGTISGISGEKNDDEMFYSFTSFTTPNKIFRVELPSLLQKEVYETELPYTPSELVTEQVSYTSKDGTSVPMFIVYKKGMKKDGENPLLLYGYGGFNTSLTPTFSLSRMIFLENGGIWVTANIRGGGEFGKKWHEAGTKLKKQNVFDDFIAAAEYLIKEKYTSSKKLAIQGGSNGGLLVGACMTQRPDLFKVALPQVGVMDMLRYQKFTIGWAWEGDYGSSDNEEEFNYLRAYSPLHNMKADVEYPCTLVTTADHDDRVVPAHSFKFTAELQSKQKGNNPVLIRIDAMAGHGAGKSTAKSIQEAVDVYSFVFWNLGMDFKSPMSK